MPKVAQKKRAASSSSDSDSGPDDRSPVKKAKNSATATSSTNKDGEKFWELDDTKRVSVRSFKGKTFVDIRAFYTKDGETRPGKQGITLQTTQWRKLLDAADDITKELESK